MSNDVTVTVTTSNPVTVTPTVNDTNISLGTVLPLKDVHKKEQFTATSSQVLFETDSIIRSDSEQVFLNGVLQQQGVDYTVTDSGGSITFASGLDEGDKVEVDYVIS